MNREVLKKTEDILITILLISGVILIAVHWA
jgi:hypothetical protein